MFFARQTLEPACRFLYLIGESALLRTTAAATALLPFERTTPLTFGFLLLPSRQLLQLFEQLVDLPIIGLLRCLIGGLVLRTRQR